MVDLYFPDSSALVKRYTLEAGSGWTRNLFARDGSTRILVSRISWVEVLSALSRLRREQQLDRDTFDDSTGAVEQHFRSEYQLVEIDSVVVELAGGLVKKHPLRAYDAVQLASALRMYNAFSSVPDLRFHFVCADVRLHGIAADEGLSVANPSEQ